MKTIFDRLTVQELRKMIDSLRSSPDFEVRALGDALAKKYIGEGAR